MAFAYADLEEIHDRYGRILATGTDMASYIEASKELGLDAYPTEGPASFRAEDSMELGARQAMMLKDAMEKDTLEQTVDEVARQTLDQYMTFHDKRFVVAKRNGAGENDKPFEYLIELDRDMDIPTAKEMQHMRAGDYICFGDEEAFGVTKEEFAKDYKVFRRSEAMEKFADITAEKIKTEELSRRDEDYAMGNTETKETALDGVTLPDFVKQFYGQNEFREQEGYVYYAVDDRNPDDVHVRKFDSQKDACEFVLGREIDMAKEKGEELDEKGMAELAEKVKGKMTYEPNSVTASQQRVTGIASASVTIGENGYGMAMIVPLEQDSLVDMVQLTQMNGTRHSLGVANRETYIENYISGKANLLGDAMAYDGYVRPANGKGEYKNTYIGGNLVRPDDFRDKVSKRALVERMLDSDMKIEAAVMLYGKLEHITIDNRSRIVKPRVHEKEKEMDNPKDRGQELPHKARLSVRPKEDIVNDLFTGLAMEDNRYRSYYEDRGRHYRIDLGNDVIDVFKNMDAAGTEIASGTVTKRNIAECTEEAYRDATSRTERCFGRMLLDRGIDAQRLVLGEKLVLSTLAKIREENMRNLTVTGDRDGFRKAYLIDSKNNYLGIIKDDNVEALGESRIGRACAVRTPDNLRPYADADLSLQGGVQVMEAIRKADTVKVDTDRCDYEWFKTAFMYIKDMRAGHVQEIDGKEAATHLARPLAGNGSLVRTADRTRDRGREAGDRGNK